MREGADSGVWPDGVFHRSIPTSEDLLLVHKRQVPFNLALGITRQNPYAILSTRPLRPRDSGRSCAAKSVSPVVATSASPCARKNHPQAPTLRNLGRDSRPATMPTSTRPC